jgi:hypothetical protein
MQISAVDNLFKCLAEFISSHLRSIQHSYIAIGKYFNVNTILPATYNLSSLETKFSYEFGFA